ncbi:MAG TPA: ThiF family adenylyltransferase, partial [Actinopolymorphaceae bacterium]
HGLTAAERERLAPDLAALSLETRGLDGGVGKLLERRRSVVAVLGAGRVGAATATLLAAAGIGTVAVEDDSPAGHGDVTPAGIAPADVERSRSDGVRRAIRAIAPSTTVPRARPGQPRQRPHVAVVAPEEEPDRPLLDKLVRAGIPHLIARVVETRAIVGPFVLPGRTSCVRCADLYRAQRDPAWPRVLAGISSEPASTTACDVVTATHAATVAAAHVLGFVQGQMPRSIDATLELATPLGRWRRRSWSVHPLCGCRWDHLDGADEQAS